METKMTATEEVLAIFARIDTEGEKMALDAQEFYSNFSKEFEFEMKRWSWDFFAAYSLLKLTDMVRFFGY